MTLLNLLFKTSTKSFIAVLFFSVLAGTSSTLIISLINTLLAKDTLETQSYLFPFCGSLLFFSISILCTETLLIKFSNTISHQLRTRITQKILSSDLAHIQSIQPHRLLAILTEDILTLTNTIAELPTLFINLPIVIGCFIYISTLSFSLFISLIIFIAIIFAVYRIPIYHAKTQLRNCRNTTNTLFKQFENLVYGIKELIQNPLKKAFFYEKTLTPTSHTLKQTTIKYRTIYRSIMKAVDISIFIGIGLLLFIAPSLLSISLPSLTPFILVLVFMVGPLGHCLNFISKYTQAQVALSHINTIESSIQNTNIVHKENLSTPTPSNTPILTLNNVHYTYKTQETNFKLGPITLNIPARKISFITGGNGSGKTTLLHILTGLYSPTQGSLQFHNQLITPSNIHHYRTHFGVIFSNFHLFEQFYTDMTKEKKDRIQHYLQAFKLTNVVTFKNNCFSSIHVSQGQRKRLALIMELCTDKSIYVFDEWAADQDPEFKAYFYQTLLPELKQEGKTIIAITHDDHYFHCSDHIINLNQGQLSKQTPQFSQPKSVPV